MPTGIYLRTSENTKQCFKKGCTPWSKGTKGLKKSNCGSFKKGHKLSVESLEKMKNSRKGQPCHNSGSKSNLWKGGITPLMKFIRTHTKYIEWRKSIFQRDNWTCKYCGAKNGNGIEIELNAHHLKPFYKILVDNKIINFEDAIKCSELWDMENGITICRECHLKTDSIGRGYKIKV